VSAPQLADGIRFRRSPDGSGALLIPEGVVNLNHSAAAIIELIDGARSSHEIAAELARRYGMDPSEIESDVSDLLERLSERLWVVLPAETA
jgi:pyrroloquinoline quinone biosynthesis protein D